MEVIAEVVVAAAVGARMAASGCQALAVACPRFVVFLRGLDLRFRGAA